jgi:hypothetical protein
MEHRPANSCGKGGNDSACSCPTSPGPEAMFPAEKEEASCCGPSPGPRAGRFERPGYRISHFVEGFVETTVGPVPRVNARPGVRDRLGTVLVRAGIGRNDYRVTPGLYAVGTPGTESPVVVSANYKLSFDTLRKHLEGVSLWVLILDTRGINVWCAAGKGTFSAGEVVSKVREFRLTELVHHRKLILPQLSATGVSAPKVKKGCGFEVLWGPIRAADLKPFISSGMKAGPAMRRISFSLVERLVLIPVELSFLPKPSLWILLAAFILSGIGPSFFSLQAASSRGLAMAAAYGAGILGGAVLVPALLPWLPGKAFSVKGALTGLAAGIGMIGLAGNRFGGLEILSLILFSVVVSSYLAMNFTGSTPFTSPSGVEKEMRRALPLQVGAILVTVIMWVGSGFYP